jgi:hypothetical protein
MLRYNGCKFVRSENASSLFYMYSYAKTYLELREVFGNASLA